MGVELDWLEREERYRRRVVRMMIVGVVLVGGVLLATGYTRGRALKERRAAEAQQMIAKRDAEREAVRAQFVADSSATANRLAEFIRVHGATPMVDVPVLVIPLPSGVGAAQLAQRVWTEYARVADPTVSATTEADWYRLYYVDLMNSGPLRGRAVLLPAMRQSGTTLAILQPSFSDITRAQIEVGMRDMPVEAAFDTSLMATPPIDPGTTPPVTPPPATAATPPVVPPATPEPPDTTPPTPDPEPPIDLEPIAPDAPNPAPPDSVPPPKD